MLGLRNNKLGEYMKKGQVSMEMAMTIGIMIILSLPLIYILFYHQQTSMNNIVLQETTSLADSLRARMNNSSKSPSSINSFK